MPTPAYVSASNMTKGVTAAETAINIESYRQRFEDPKEYVQSIAGSRTGFARNFDPSSSCTISGETNTALLTGVLGVAFGTAETVANAISGYGVTAGGFYMDDIEISQDRGSFISSSVNLTRLPDIT